MTGRGGCWPAVRALCSRCDRPKPLQPPFSASLRSPRAASNIIMSSAELSCCFGCRAEPLRYARQVCRRCGCDASPRRPGVHLHGRLPRPRCAKLIPLSTHSQLSPRHALMQTFVSPQLATLMQGLSPAVCSGTALMWSDSYGAPGTSAAAKKKLLGYSMEVCA